MARITNQCGLQAPVGTCSGPVALLKHPYLISFIASIVP